MPNVRNFLSRGKKAISNLKIRRKSQTIACPNCGRQIQQGSQHCPFCGQIFVQTSPTPSILSPKIPKKNEVKCLQCGAVYSKNKAACPYCGTSNPLYRDIVTIRDSFGKRVGARVYEALIFIVIGIFCLVGTPFFGLPSFPLLAIAFIFCIPAYIFFPSEHDVLNSIAEGSDIGRQGWLLLPKSAFKLAAYILIIIQFFMINRLIALAVSFFFYFTLPTRYKTSQPYKAMEAWARMGFGIFLAFLFFMTFSESLASINTMAISLGFLGAAFFITFPTQLAADDEDSKIKISLTDKYGSLSEGKTFFYIDRTIFSILMLIGLFTFGFSTEMMHITFYIIWALSFFVGWSAGPEGRPAMGILTIMIALFVFSTTYTGVVGQAIFGYYWPQVQSFSESFIGPLEEVWYQAQKGMSDAWLMMTDPQGYIIKKEREKEIEGSNIKSGGKRESIELSRFELFSLILDPVYEPLSGTVELHNKGEFNANFIKLNIHAFWIDPNAENKDNEVPVGSVEFTSCSGGSITSSGSVASCEWQGTEQSPAAYPTEIKFASFKFDKDEWGSLSTIVEGDEGDKYEYGGNTVKVRASYDYNYNVNVSIPIEVIPMDEYERLLRAREIILQDFLSEYSGGPVKATINSQKQPLRNSDQSLVRVSLLNEGRANITEITNYRISVPVILNPGPLQSSTFNNGGCSEGSGWTPLPGNSDILYIDCSYTPGGTTPTGGVYPQVEPDQYRTATFLISPQAVTETQITTQIIGTASYSYISTKDINIQIAAGPFIS